MCVVVVPRHAYSPIAVTSRCSLLVVPSHSSLLALLLHVNVPLRGYSAASLIPTCCSPTWFPAYCSLCGSSLFIVPCVVFPYVIIQHPWSLFPACCSLTLLLHIPTPCLLLPYIVAPRPYSLLVTPLHCCSTSLLPPSCILLVCSFSFLTILLAPLCYCYSPHGCSPFACWCSPLVFP